MDELYFNEQRDELYFNKLKLDKENLLNLIPFKGADGREYATSEDLARADRDYFDGLVKRTRESLFTDPISRREPREYFEGLDGKRYPTLTERDRANQSFLDRVVESYELPNPYPEKKDEFRLFYIGMDGRDYATTEALERADKAYWDRVRKQDELPIPNPRDSDRLIHYHLDSDRLIPYNLPISNPIEEKLIHYKINPDRIIDNSNKSEEPIEYFVGLDGRTYATSIARDLADDAFLKRKLKSLEIAIPYPERKNEINLSYIGPDGRDYQTYEALQAARREWNRQFNQKKDLKDFLR
jgi:hypothetical protein